MRLASLTSGRATDKPASVVRKTPGRSIGWLAFIGSYFASYLKKKGENRAIHEDLSKLVDQVSAVLQTVIETLGGWGHFARFALYNRAPMREVADI